MVELKAVSDGRVIALSQVSDQVFSSGILGDGIGIRPKNGTVVAPADGEVTMLLKSSGHAMGLHIDGIDFLIHVGIGTVALKGEGFRVFTQQGEQVKRGQKLLEFDKELLERRGFCPDIIFLRMKKEEAWKRDITFRWGVDAKAGETLVGIIEDTE